MAAAVLLAVGVFFPRRYLVNPDVPALTRGFIDREPGDTHWAITQSVNRALPQIQRVLSSKSFMMGMATILLVASLAMIGGRRIYSVAADAPSSPSARTQK